MRPLNSGHAPITPAPTAAVLRPLLLIQPLNRVIVACVWREHIAEQWQLEKSC